MAQIDCRDAEALQTLVSEEFGEWSAPVSIDQEMINQFADLTGDQMWLHVDEERCAKQSPFGCTIAHGFLILSLLPKMPCGINLPAELSGYKNIMNYGSDRLRFMAPVTVNSEIHARNRVKAIEVAEKKTKVTLEVQVVVVGQENPSLVYELIMVFL